MEVFIIVHQKEVKYVTSQIGKQLKEIRTKRFKVTLEDLADELDVSVKTVQCWESGKNSMKIERILSLYEAFSQLTAEDLNLNEFLIMLIIDVYE